MKCLTRNAWRLKPKKEKNPFCLRSNTHAAAPGSRCTRAGRRPAAGRRSEACRGYTTKEPYSFHRYIRYPYIWFQSWRFLPLVIFSSKCSRYTLRCFFFLFAESELIYLFLLLFHLHPDEEDEDLATEQITRGSSTWKNAGAFQGRGNFRGSECHEPTTRPPFSSIQQRRGFSSGTYETSIAIM